VKHGITGIDHPVAAVRDMDAARATYERLGFIVPPRGRHREWGTGNWCIQFARDYIELRGLIDPHKETHGLDRFLEKGEGLMGVALGTVGAQSTHDQLVAAGLHPRPAKPLTRDFELPEGPITVSFVLSFLDPAETPGLGSVVICEHLTPERLRRPEWLQHPNGARRVRGLVGVASDLDGVAAAWEQLFERVSRPAGELRAELDDGGVLSLLEPEAFAHRFPSLPPPPESRQARLRRRTSEARRSASPRRA
jgi:catechol 2,3-dioxygenase-like lactoylglutathione lyase family enzyme